MNGTRFDTLTRRLNPLLSRRLVLSALPVAGAGLLLAGATKPTEARQPVASVGGFPYLTSAQAEQVGQGPIGPATVRVSWTFGDVIPDLIQILQPGDATTVAGHFADVPIDTGAQTPLSVDLQVTAPNLLRIMVCPRVVEGGVMLDRIEDEAGQPQYWDNFCIWLPTLAVAATEAPANNANLLPTLGRVDIGKGEFTVHWDASSDVDHFNARLVPAVTGFNDQKEVGGGDRSYRVQGAYGGVEYQFSLQGCHDGGLWGSTCSDWVSTSVTMPVDQGFDAWRPWFQIHPEWTGNQATPVTAIARRSDNVALFKVGLDGSAWSTYWEPDAESWRPWFTIFPEFKFAQEAPITAVSRSPSHLDLFTTGLDGAVWTAWWDDGGGGWRSWFPIFPETVFRQDRPVSVVSRRGSNNISIFRVGFDGAIWSTYWEADGGGWRPWGTVFPENRFPLEARVTAHSRTAGSLEIYVVGTDGAVWSAWWSDDGGGWRPWFSIYPETVFAPDQEIVAVSRTALSVELFTVGLDGAVWTAWWSEDGAWRPWSQIFPETRFDPSSRIGAVSRKTGHVDLFITGLDGAVWSAPGVDDGVGWRPWFQIHPQTVFDQRHPVAVLARIEDQIDLYKVGFDGAVWTSFWAP